LKLNRHAKDFLGRLSDATISSGHGDLQDNERLKRSHRF